ncbi:hypothetical protein BHE74_00053229, partial [Ensete ventricosum]
IPTLSNLKAFQTNAGAGYRRHADATLTSVGEDGNLTSEDAGGHRRGQTKPCVALMRLPSGPRVAGVSKTFPPRLSHLFHSWSNTTLSPPTILARPAKRDVHAPGCCFFFFFPPWAPSRVLDCVDGFRSFSFSLWTQRM